MKTLRGTLTTTRVDRHGDRMMLSALDSALEHVARTFVPLGVQHDPRIAPIGRLVSAAIRQLDDGEYALEGEWELFEAGDTLEEPPADRTLPIHRFPAGKVALLFDRQLRSPADAADVAEIARCLDVTPEEEIKKSLDPLAILTIGGTFVLGGIAAGFLSRVGEDAYEAMKANLKKLFQRRNPAKQETLLMLVFVVHYKGRDVEVEVIASRPDARAIDDMLGARLRLLDEAVPGLLSKGTAIQRLVFEYVNGALKLRFAVRSDARPLFPVFPDEAPQRRLRPTSTRRPKKGRSRRRRG